MFEQTVLINNYKVIPIPILRFVQFLYFIFFNEKDIKHETDHRIGKFLYNESSDLT